ncbi:MAG: transposase, partial [Cytophagales bacterium]|nr:transposase [Cytophagales bacterium]
KNSDYLKEKKRRYRTKNELARCLIYWIKRRGLPFDYLTFDSWYVSKENLNLFQRLGITYYAAVKNNRIFNQKGNALSCRKIAAKLKTRDYTNYKTRNLRAKSFSGYLNGVKHDQTLVVIKNANRSPYLECLLKVDEVDEVDKDGKKKEPKDQNAYFITNNLKETTFGVISCYRSRWKIEEMFRDLKQNLGFSACQHRSIEAVTRHFALCLFAYVCLQFLRNDVESKMTDPINPSLTIGDVKTHLKRQMIVTQPILNASSGWKTAKYTPISKKMLERWTGPDNPMVITLCHNGGAYCLDID